VMYLNLVVHHPQAWRDCEILHASGRQSYFTTKFNIGDCEK
jgi:hypothetical protein